MDATVEQILFHQEYLVAIEQRRIVPYPDANRVLMFGPHPDDIVLGCGGTAIRYRQAKVPVTFCCLTDGRACVGDPRERERMVEIRAREEKEAAAICGVENVELIAYPEDRYTHSDELPDVLAAVHGVFHRHQPDAVFVPYWFELHPWHRYTNFMLARALEHYTHDCIVYVYEVLSLVPPRLVVDISAEFPQKQKAIEAYPSQLALRDYVEDMKLIGGRNARLIGPEATNAEVFQGFARDAYIDRVLRLGLERPEAMQTGAQPVIPEKPTRS